jgi:hypothetical protein
MVGLDSLRSDLDLLSYELPRKIDFMTIDLQTFAEQMTLVDQRYFESLSIADFFGEGYKKTPSHPASLWIEHCNTLSQWFASTVVQIGEARDRAIMIDRFVKLGTILWDIGNFSGAVTIYLTLCLNCIAKLKKEWSRIPQLSERFEQFENQIRPMNNFAGYRAALKARIGPTIPYLAILMKDIIVMEETMKFTKEDGTAWFSIEGLDTLTQVVDSQFVQLQSRKYHFEMQSSLFKEILNPSKSGLISLDTSRGSSKSKKTKAKRAPKFRAKSRTIGPRIALSFAEVKDLASFEMDSPAPTDRSPWKGHSNLCLTQLKRTNFGDPRSSETVAAISAVFSNALISGENPNASAFQAASSMESLSKCLDSLITVLRMLPLTRLAWTAETLPTPTGDRLLSSAYQTRFQALSIEMVLALMHTMKCLGAQASDARIEYISSESDERVTMLCISIGFFDPDNASTSKAEAAVLSLLSPDSAHLFISSRVRLSISRIASIKCRTTAQVFLPCPLAGTTWN